MKKQCGIVQDLLPLYLDGVCGEESRNLVEEHLQVCEGCRSMRKELQAELPIQEGKMQQSEVEILKKTSWNINKKAVFRAFGITLIVIYWLVYFCQEYLADRGDYRYFSFSFCEVYGIGTIVIPIVTVVWMISIVVTAIRTKSWKKHIAFLLLLLVLNGWQGKLVYDQSRIVHVTCATQVAAFFDETHIGIYNGDIFVTLEVPPMLMNLLWGPSYGYWFSYETDMDNPYHGKLVNIQRVSEVTEEMMEQYRSVQ